jgi:transcriptional regulator with XRE-family HTH domain
MKDYFHDIQNAPQRLSLGKKMERSMLSETLTTALAGYAIGPKIRALRLGRELGLTQLGKHTGLSPALLSKIERGQIFPTLPTLQRVAMVFGVGLEHFFRPDTDRPLVAVVRKGDRLRFPEKPGRTAPAYFFESLDYPVSNRKLNAYYVEVESETQASEPHAHPGAEIAFVLQGELVINVAGEDHALKRGDAMYFDCTNPHTYRRNGQSRCSALVVVTA